MVARRSPHPVVWTILYVPFGALGGFVSIALTFLATEHGLSITEGSLFNGAQFLMSWLKWIWAPAVDVTLTPKRWYMLATSGSALGVLGMAATPMSPSTLPILIGMVIAASFINSIVGMSVEAMIASVTTDDEAGRTGAWFQAGNLGGSALGGGLALYLMKALPAPWMCGVIIGGIFVACSAALQFVPLVEAHARTLRPVAAIKAVGTALVSMVKTKGGLLSAMLCLLPIGTGAAQGVMTQSKVAAHWGAGDTEVELVQGLFAGIVVTIGCFAGGWVAKRFTPRAAYLIAGIGAGVVAVIMAFGPKTVPIYVAFNLIYAFSVGATYPPFTAFALNAIGIGASAAATKYNVLASLANFPIWWMGLLLGRIADRSGVATMLLTEAALGVCAVAAFAATQRWVSRTRLPDRDPAADGR